MRLKFSYLKFWVLLFYFKCIEWLNNVCICNTSSKFESVLSSFLKFFVLLLQYVFPNDNIIMNCTLNQFILFAISHIVKEMLLLFCIFCKRIKNSGFIYMTMKPYLYISFVTWLLTFKMLVNHSKCTSK